MFFNENISDVLNLILLLKRMLEKQRHFQLVTLYKRSEFFHWDLEKYKRKEIIEKLMSTIYIIAKLKYFSEYFPSRELFCTVEKN